MSWRPPGDSAVNGLVELAFVSWKVPTPVPIDGYGLSALCVNGQLENGQDCCGGNPQLIFSDPPGSLASGATIFVRNHDAPPRPTRIRDD